MGRAGDFPRGAGGLCRQGQSAHTGGAPGSQVARQLQRRAGQGRSQENPPVKSHQASTNLGRQGRMSGESVDIETDWTARLARETRGVLSGDGGEVISVPHQSGSLLAL